MHLIFLNNYSLDYFILWDYVNTRSLLDIQTLGPDILKNYLNLNFIKNVYFALP